MTGSMWQPLLLLSHCRWVCYGSTPCWLTVGPRWFHVFVSLPLFQALFLFFPSSYLLQIPVSSDGNEQCVLPRVVLITADQIWNASMSCTRPPCCQLTATAAAQDGANSPCTHSSIPVNIYIYIHGLLEIDCKKINQMVIKSNNNGCCILYSICVCVCNFKV